MTRRHLILASALMILLAWAGSAQAADDGDSFTGVARVVAIGDIHADFGKLVAVLRLCHVIDDKLRWAAGRTHLVQTGDAIDRGPDAGKVLDLLMALGPQALAAGGQVHALIGNHEAMNMLGDLRYVSAADAASFRDPGRRAAAFSPQGKYGAWILGHAAILRIDGTLFMHGGLSPAYADRDLQKVNQAIRAQLRAGSQEGPATDDQGPLWYRGLAQPATDAALLGRILAAQKVSRIVVGHTIQEGGIRVLQDGKLALIDVGMSSGALGAPPSCLVIDRSGGGDKAVVIK